MPFLRNCDRKKDTLINKTKRLKFLPKCVYVRRVILIKFWSPHRNVQEFTFLLKISKMNDTHMSL